jgi:hypothetical protein
LGLAFFVFITNPRNSSVGGEHMFRDARPGLASYCDTFEIKPTLLKSWNHLEGDPLGREKLEFRLGLMIQLLLRSEGGDALAREELKAIG